MLYTSRTSRTVELFHLDYLLERLRTTTWKEISVVILMFLIVHLLKFESVYNLQPKWRKMKTKKTATARPNVIDIDFSSIPNPVVASLYDNKSNYVILISSDHSLVISKLLHHNSVPQVLPHLPVLKSVPLPCSRDVWPVVMETGYLNNLRDNKIIVLLLADWTVLCFNNRLELQWTNSLSASHIGSDVTLTSAAALITPHYVKKSGNGMIFVGYGMSPSTHSDSQQSYGSHSNVSHGSASFTVFALSGKDGSVIWQSTPRDQAEDARAESKVAPHWKLGLKHHRHSRMVLKPHMLLSILPHSWDLLSDTHFGLLNSLIQTNSSRPDPRRTTLSALWPLSGRQVTDQESGLSRLNHTKFNAIIVHHKYGVEVFSMSTGHRLTQFDVTPGTLYADLKADQSIYEIRLLSERDDCFLVVKKHVKKTTLFTASLCYSGMALWSKRHMESFSKSLSPLSVLRSSLLDGVFHHLRGAHLNAKSLDIIVPLSSGRVISIGADGFRHWETKTKSGWLNHVNKMSQSLSENETPFMPSIQRFSLKSSGPEQWVILSGWDHLSVIDIQNGALVSQHSLPCQPLKKLTVGDFDNDGLNDIIVTCSLGYIGFSIIRVERHMWTFLVGVAVFITIPLITASMSHLYHQQAFHYD